MVDQNICSVAAVKMVEEYRDVHVNLNSTVKLKEVQ